MQQCILNRGCLYFSVVLGTEPRALSHIPNLRVTIHLCLWHWCLNSGPCTCWPCTLPLEPFWQPSRDNVKSLLESLQETYSLVEAWLKQYSVCLGSVMPWVQTPVTIPPQKKRYTQSNKKDGWYYKPKAFVWDLNLKFFKPLFLKLQN
jgi:hypothetical protein